MKVTKLWKITIFRVPAIKIIYLIILKLFQPTRLGNLVSLTKYVAELAALAHVKLV